MSCQSRGGAVEPSLVEITDEDTEAFLDKLTGTSPGAGAVDVDVDVVDAAVDVVDVGIVSWSDGDEPANAGGVESMSTIEVLR